MIAPIVLSRLFARLQARGLDLAAPFTLAAYRARLASLYDGNSSSQSSRLHIAPFGESTDVMKEDEDAVLGIIVGNSGGNDNDKMPSFWTCFREHVRNVARSTKLHSPDSVDDQSLVESLLGKQPLDAFVEQIARTEMRAALEETFVGQSDIAIEYDSQQRLFSVLQTQQDEKASMVLQLSVFFSHETKPGRLIAMQQLADLVGLARLDHDAHLCIHPLHGPWISLRMVVFLRDMTLLSSSSSVVSEEAMASLRQSLLSVRIPSPHESLSLTDAEVVERLETCRPAIQSAMRTALEHNTLTPPGSRNRWEAWLAVRDAVDIGRSIRYSQEQIRYHYSGDRSILAAWMREEFCT